MRILYIVPKINDEGGVSRVLSIKTNYLVDIFGYEIHILTQNDGNRLPFFDFNDKINLYDIKLKGNPISYLIKYRNELKKGIKKIDPDLIVVCDNGLKGHIFPWIYQTKVPIVFESHGSRFIEEKKIKFNLFHKIGVFLKKNGAKSFDKFIVLSEESKKEWQTNNIEIINNPNWVTVSKRSELNNKIAISIARHSHEKGIDRLLLVWKKVIEKHSDWILYIYGKIDKEYTYPKLAESLNITKNVIFFEPIKNIQDKYIEASMYLMTSRFEGFPMVLVEAMTSGLPCVAFDCPAGLSPIIKDAENGFIIPDNQMDHYAEKVIMLIENGNLIRKMGEKAFESSRKYDVDTIMNQWNKLFKSLTLK